MTRISDFTPQQMLDAYDTACDPRFPDDLAYTGAAMILIGPQASDDALEHVARQIRKLVEER